MNLDNIFWDNLDVKPLHQLSWIIINNCFKKVHYLHLDSEQLHLKRENIFFKKKNILICCIIDRRKRDKSCQSACAAQLFYLLQIHAKKKHHYCVLWWKAWGKKEELFQNLDNSLLFSKKLLINPNHNRSTHTKDMVRKRKDNRPSRSK